MAEKESDSTERRRMKTSPVHYAGVLLEEELTRGVGKGSGKKTSPRSRKWIGGSQL